MVLLYITIIKRYVHRLLLFFGVGFILLGLWSCNLLTINENLSEYPTVYPSLEKSEINALNAEFQSANNNHICSTLNQYGFTGYSEIFFIDGESPCANRNVVRQEINEIDTLITVAKKSLLKNKTYTGVEDTAGLMIKEIMPINGCTICEGPDYNNVPIELKITFGSQFVDTTEVLNTEITVFVDAKGVNRIWGNWYSEFSRPGFVNYGYEDVQQGMVGWQIDMRPFTGEEQIYTVREEDVRTRPKRVILPHENKNEEVLEIRTSWAVPITYNHTNNNFAGWTAYIDIEEGTLIKLTAAEHNRIKLNL